MAAAAAVESCLLLMYDNAHSGLFYNMTTVIKGPTHTRPGALSCCCLNKTQQDCSGQTERVFSRGPRPHSSTNLSLSDFFHPANVRFTPV